MTSCIKTDLNWHTFNSVIVLYFNTFMVLWLDMTVFNSGELMENLLFTLADFEVKMLFGIGFEISKTSHKYGQYQPKVGKDWNFHKYISVDDHHFQCYLKCYSQIIKYFGLVARLNDRFDPCWTVLTSGSGLCRKSVKIGCNRFFFRHLEFLLIILWHSKLTKIELYRFEP